MPANTPSMGLDGGLSMADALARADALDHEEDEQQENDDELDEALEALDDDGSDDESEQPDDQAPAGDGLEEVEYEGKRYRLQPELKNALLRQSDYTKKQQATAEQRKAVEQQAQQVEAERLFYANQLSGFVRHLAQQIQHLPTEEQLLELSQKDPVGYIQKRAERDKVLVQMQQAQSAQEQLTRQQQAEEKRRFDEYVTEQRSSLMTKLPEWRDQKVAEKEMGEMTSYLTELGYSQDELKNLFDHRAYLVARDAAAYRKLVASKKDPDKLAQKVAPKAMPAGTAPNKPQRGDLGKMRAQLRKSGRVEDALRYLNAAGD